MGCSCLISIRVLVTLKAGRTTEPLGAFPRRPPYCRNLRAQGPGTPPRHGNRLTSLLSGTREFRR